MYHKINYVHQIIISENSRIKLPRKGVVYSNMQSIEEVYPSSIHKIWNSEKIEKFLRNNFPEDVFLSYKKLVPFAYKADLARYCILYIYGGIYVDLGIKFVNKWNIPLQKKFATFKEISFPSDSWTTMQNGLIWSLPGRRELLYCIRYIVENCQNEFYGKSPLYITGPIMFGRAIAAAMVEGGQSESADDQFIGEYRWTTPEHGIKNDAYVSPDHSLIAFRTKHMPGDLTHLGIKGTNNYNVIWRNRKVFGERDYLFSFKRYGNVLDDRLKTSFPRDENGLLVEVDSSHLISFGPYLSLGKGFYRIHISISREYVGDFSLSITINGGKKEIKCIPLGISESINVERDAICFSFYFNLERSVELFEVLLRSVGSFFGYIRGYKIEISDSMTFDTKVKKEWLSVLPDIQAEMGGKIEGGISFTPHQRGRISYGPYAQLEAGKYILKVFFEHPIVVRNLFIELAHKEGKRKIKTFRFLRYSKTDILVCPFTLHSSVSDLEFRVHTRGGVAGKILSFNVSEKI